ncbi:hypothetical protein EKK58_09435 [Candidatus Dependentiae bacterium]|nr:MAG: hypothetical protein EKK58_09435 [Candidatus Dependentiae bacterium]
MIGREIVYLRRFEEEAKELRKDYGYTRLFSAGSDSLDDYLGGGYGRANGYEVVLLFGPTKIGKSMVALNFLRKPIEVGKRVGLMTLEDAGADVFIRIADIVGKEVLENRILKGDTVHIMSPDDLIKSWKLTELLAMIEEWFTIRNIDVILLDHLQFAFEGAEAIRGENEYISQRIFMQKLNQLMKRVNKTIILVSHINKDNSSKGINKVVGSGSIAQAATKLIEVSRNNDTIGLKMWGSRFTKTPNDVYYATMVGSYLKGMDKEDELNQEDLPF